MVISKAGKIGFGYNNVVKTTRLLLSGSTTIIDHCGFV